MLSGNRAADKGCDGRLGRIGRNRRGGGLAGGEDDGGAEGAGGRQKGREALGGSSGSYAIVPRWGGGTLVYS